VLHLYSPFLEAMGLTAIHARVPGMAAVRIEGCSHWVHLDQPAAFNRQLAGFIHTGWARRGPDP